MKKIILLTAILIISFTSTAFRGCSVSLFDPAFGFIMRAITSGYSSIGDGGDFGAFIIGVGTNGQIVKYYGGDTLRFISKTSGTSQTLNSARIQPTSFEPTIIAVGNNGTIVHSTDNGETWGVSVPVTSANLYSTDLNGVYGYAVGDNGTILLSFNNGANWSQIPSGTVRNLKAIGMHPQFASDVVAVGEKGTILRTSNSGANWVNVGLADTTIDLYSITQKPRSNTNMQNLYVCGSQGKIFKSTNRGANWVLKNSGTANTLRSIYFSSNDSGAVTGDNGTVRMTTDGGETWFSNAEFNSVTGSVASICDVSRPSRTVLAVSDGKIYLASEDPPYIGISNISSEAPKDFSLNQNYPNPFNPVTKIGLKLPKGSFAKLTVYDITGKEIETLVNEQLHAGTYEYEWNGINLPSGVYFYKLEAEGFIQTKKMLMVK
jgi:photosystem II stability/assembly factor-like uncharacterized protein